MTEQNGVYVSPAALNKFAGFERLYLSLREREGREFSNEEIKRLPFVRRGHPHAREWRMRRDTIRRFTRFLDKASARRKILDVGCGNGFFSNRLAVSGHTVSAVDVNLAELRQAAFAFGTENPKWYCADMMTDEIPGGPFDMIVFHASFQYFEDTRRLLVRCFELLKTGGTVQILETPFYDDPREAAAAFRRAEAHFTALGVPGMINCYRCLSWQALNGINYRVKKRSAGLFGRLFRTASPFPWIEVSGISDSGQRSSL